MPHPYEESTTHRTIESTWSLPVVVAVSNSGLQSSGWQYLDQDPLTEPAHSVLKKSWTSEHSFHSDSHSISPSHNFTRNPVTLDCPVKASLALGNGHISHRCAFASSQVTSSPNLSPCKTTQPSANTLSKSPYFHAKAVWFLSCMVQCSGSNSVGL